MKYFENLYIGKNMPLSKTEILIRLQSDEVIKDWYFLVHITESNTILEIIHGTLLESVYYQRMLDEQVVIVGVANKYNEAVALTQTIIDEMYQKTGTFHLLQFMEDTATNGDT